MDEAGRMLDAGLLAMAYHHEVYLNLTLALTLNPTPRGLLVMPFHDIESI